ncbi:hypothetical protein [Nocardia acididurans]|nr:hypothetical protein [Nocardia acididurans]
MGSPLGVAGDTPLAGSEGADASGMEDGARSPCPAVTSGTA